MHYARAYIAGAGFGALMFAAAATSAAPLSQTSTLHSEAAPQTTIQHDDIRSLSLARHAGPHPMCGSGYFWVDRGNPVAPAGGCQPCNPYGRGNPACPSWDITKNKPS